VDRDRLTRIRNWQSDDWYAALVMRPICILVMLVIADWRWLTPNRLTTLGNLCKLAAVILIVPSWAAAVGTSSSLVGAAVLLQFGLLFDHLDGTVARYRRAFSTFGSVYDKTSDILTWFLICLALGWRVYQESGDALALALGTSSAYALAVRGYMKWLVAAESEKLRWHQAKADPAAAVARRTGPPQISRPPTRTFAQWLRWLGRTSFQFYRFEEVDLFFWVSLGLVLDRLPALIWLLFLSQVGALIGLLVYRHLEAHRVDGALRAAGNGRQSTASPGPERESV